MYKYTNWSQIRLLLNYMYFCKCPSIFSMTIWISLLLELSRPWAVFYCEVCRSSRSCTKGPSWKCWSKGKKTAPLSSLLVVNLCKISKAYRGLAFKFIKGIFFIVWILCPQGTEVLSKLYAAHQEGKKSVGVDVEVCMGSWLKQAT